MPTSPANALHRVGRATLYKSTQATPTATCDQLSKSLQCINGTFSGVNEYPYATCQDNNNRRPCIDKRTNNFFPNLYHMNGYTQQQSSTMQACSAFQIQLQCID